MEPTRGVVYVAVGDPAYARMARDSIASLRRSGYRGEVAMVVHGEDAPARRGDLDRNVRIIAAPGGEGPFASRALKTALAGLTPFAQTLYLDCDTLIIWPLDEVWDRLRRAAADVALALDAHPAVGEALRAAPRERRGTLREWQATRAACGDDAPYFNGGVVLWRRSEASSRFFDAWHDEWRRFGAIDQFALVRALARCRTAVATLPRRYNAPSTGFRDAAEAARAGISVLHFCPKSQQQRFAGAARQRRFDLHTLTLRGGRSAAAAHGLCGTNFD